MTFKIELDHETKQLLHKIMAALDNLNTSIAALTTAVSNLPQAGAPPAGGATEAQVQTAADQIAAQTEIIVAKSTAPTT